MLGVVLACALLLTSCEPQLSLRSLYTSDDVVFDPNLIGSWVMSEQKDSSEFAQMDFVKVGADGYAITFMIKDSPAAQLAKVSFDAHLVKLHGRLFIDVVQTAVELDGKPSERQITIPGHMFGRISIDGNTLRMSFLDDEWMGRAIAAGAVSIDSEDEDHQPRVLTATTAELQKFVVDHADDDQAFSFDSR